MWVPHRNAVGRRSGAPAASVVATLRRIPCTVAGYVDLHAHVLPGIDDGPSDEVGALAMVRAASAAGIETIAATPHLRSDFPDVHADELERRCRALREATANDGIDIRIVSGAEVSLVWALDASDDQLALATYDQHGTDLLIETPTFNVVGLERLLYQLRTKGLRVTLAHPERNVEFQRDPRRLVELTRQGVLLQVNAETLLDRARRSDTDRLARYLCAQGLVHVLASDGHRAAVWRPVTCLPDVKPAAVALVGPERAHWMMQTAPAAVIAGAEIPVAPQLPTVRQRSRLLRRR